ncbi:MAG TPA: hypothetical protein VF787_04325 [Thermoanaerobaculia bacterium]
MSTALLIAARDVREKGRLFLIAAVLACMPFLATLLPSSRGHRADVIAGVGGFLGLMVGLGLAAAFGILTFGRELSEKRMSFWYSKPISPGSLWVGRSLGALLSAIACFAIIVLPSMLLAGKAWHVRWLDEQWQIPTAILAAMLILYFFSHAASTMLRSRSAILGIDLAAAILAFGALAYIVRPVLFTAIFLPLLATIGVLFVVVLMVAPYWQLANGRTDLRRNHAALSRAMWTGVAIVLALAGVMVLWLTSATPSTFDRVESLSQSASGNALFVTGTAPYRRGAESTYAVSTASGDRDRLALPPFTNIAFSRDSRFAAWVEPGMFQWSRGSIIIRDLTTNENQSLGVDSSIINEMVFSDDGARLAVRDGGSITVYDRATAKILAAMPVEPNPRYSFWFVSPDVLRVVSHKPVGRASVPVEIVELDVRTKKRVVTGRSESLPRYNLVSVSRDSSRMLLRSNRLIVDGRTGATIAQLPGAEGNVFTSAMLSDGRVVLSAREKNVTTLRVYSRDGVLERSVELPVRVAWISGERTDGTLILLGFTKTDNYTTGQGRTMFLVDVNRGAIVKSVPDVKGPGPYWDRDPRLIVYDAKAKLAAVDASGKLTYWN